MGLTRVIVAGRNCFANNTRLREVKVASEPEVLLTVLKKGGYQLKRIGLEAGACRNGYSARSAKRVCR
jgi:hypothetical protein